MSCLLGQRAPYKGAALVDLLKGLLHHLAVAHVWHCRLRQAVSVAYKLKLHVNSEMLRVQSWLFGRVKTVHHTSCGAT